MGLLQRIKDWFTGKSSSSSGNTRSANRVSNYGGGGSTFRQSVESSGSASFRRQLLKKKREEEEKKKKVEQAFKAEEHKSGQSAVKPKVPVEPKQKIIQDRAEQRRNLLNEYNKATGNRYNVAGAKDKAEELKRRQAQKSQAFDAEAAKFEVKAHPIASSAARGALSGVTFGGSELVAKYAPKSNAAKEAEQFYQENKNKGAEFAGEIAGSLVGFGATAGLSARGVKAAASKLAPKALEKTTAGATEKLAASSLVRRAAEKEAVKRFGADGATKEVIAQIARRKAGEAVAELGKDTAINLTTGLASDISHSVIDSADENGNINWREFAKSMGTNAAMNVALGGATSLVPAFRAGRGVAQNIDEVAEVVGRPIQQRTMLDDLADADDFEAFVNANVDNPEVRSFVTEGDGIDALERLWRDTRIERQKQNLRPVSKEEAIATVRKALPENVIDGWFRNGDSNYKPMIENAVAADPDAVNAGLNIAYHNYLDANPTNPLPFEEWLTTPQTMYRGTSGQNAIADDVFSAFTPNRDVAESFGGQVEEITVRPIDTLGSYQTTAEQEFLIPEALVNGNVKPSEAVAVSTNSSVPEAVGAAPKAAGTSVEPSAARQTESDFPFATVDDDIPVDNPAQTRINDTTADLQNRAVQIAKGEATPPEVKVNQPSEAGELPAGVRQAREAHLKATEEEVVGGKPTNFSDRYDAYKEYHQSQGTSERRKQSKAAASQINAMDSEAERELREKLARQGDLDYNTISTPELYEQVSKEFRDDAEHWIGRIIDASDDMDKISAKEIPEMQARCQYLMAVLDPSADAGAEAAYTAAFKVAKDISSLSGQSLNLRRNFVHLTEAGKIESVVDDLVKMLDSSIGFSKKHKLPRGKYDRINAIKGIIMDDPEIKSGVEKLVKAKNEDAVAEAYTELMLTLNKNNPKTGFDVIQELRYLNMLGNPKTHIRNIAGSALFAPLRWISNSIRSGIEDAISKKAGLAVTRHGGLSFEAFKEARTKNPKTEAGKKAAEAFDKLKRDILGSAKYDNPQYKGRAKTAAGKFLDTLSDLNSSLLAKEDDFFRQRAFKENYIKSYNKYLKSGTPITEKLERRIEEEAIRESQIATFNEYNSLADFLNKIERKAYDAKASTGERVAGAAVNAVMPFTKVPANILKQSINYSPAGIARGYANIAKAARNGDAQMLNTAIDQLASGLTGSGVMALGLFLGANTDAFTTNAGKEDYAAKFKKAQGVQNYSVTFTDPDTGKATSVTLDWLVPTSSVFFMGVELANQMKSGDFNALDFGGDWAQVTARLIEPVLETSMLSGLYSTLESMRSSYGDDDKQSALALMGRETVQSYLNSLIPTMAGQVARTAYKSDKQVSGDTDWEYFRNSMKSKTGLAADNAVTRKLGIEPLGADTTAYGDVKGEKKSPEDYAKSALKNFLSPANIQKVDLSELDRKKIKQYEDAVKGGADPKEMAYLFPKKQYKKTFSVGDMDAKMSNEDLSTYNQAKTKGGEEAMRLALEGIMFNRYEKDASGAKVLKSGYTEAEKQKLIKAAKGKSMREIEEWLYKQPQFKSATEAEQRRVINHMWNLTGQGKSQGAKRVGEQAVIKAQGGDVNEYNFKNELSDKKQQALLPAVKAGIITYEEAVDFARHAGKTYYYENDEGGSSSTYFNKREMIEYLVKKGYSFEKAEALFNAFKASNAKPYSGNSLSSGGYRRGGYRRGGYRRRGGGGSSKKLVSQKMKSSAYNTKQFKPKVSVPTKTTSSGSKSLAAALQDIQKTQAKITPPKNR